jgi:hypothetical protein
MVHDETQYSVYLCASLFAIVGCSCTVPIPLKMSCHRQGSGEIARGNEDKRELGIRVVLVVHAVYYFIV